MAVVESNDYNSLMSANELAAHEAVDFKNIKGVYKNCRGIWAAQWTDERGQRHTKYFNPKYFSTEAEARYEAFRFKMHIAREIELRGGYRRRSYWRTRLVDRTIHRGSNKRSNICKMGLRLVASDHLENTSNNCYLNPIQSLDDQSSSLCSYSMLGHPRYSDDMSLYPSFYPHVPEYMSPSPSQHQQYEHPLSNMILNGTEYSAGTTNISPQSSESYYNSVDYPPMFFNPAFFSDSMNLSLSDEYTQPLRVDAELPYGTSLCVCGCGMLAINPSIYAAHHKPECFPVVPTAFRPDLQQLVLTSPNFMFPIEKENIFQKCIEDENALIKPDLSTNLFHIQNNNNNLINTNNDNMSNNKMFSNSIIDDNTNVGASTTATNNMNNVDNLSERLHPLYEPQATRQLVSTDDDLYSKQF